MRSIHIFSSVALAIAAVACTTQSTNGAVTEPLSHITVITATDGRLSVKAGTTSGSLALDSSLPFTAAHVYATTAPVTGARWGNHGGPMVTTTDAQDHLTATRWTLSGTTATASTLSPQLASPEAGYACGARLSTCRSMTSRSRPTRRPTIRTRAPRRRPRSCSCRRTTTPSWVMVSSTRSTQCRSAASPMGRRRASSPTAAGAR